MQLACPPLFHQPPPHTDGTSYPGEGCGTPAAIQMAPIGGTMVSCPSVQPNDRAGNPAYSKYCTLTKAGRLLSTTSWVVPGRLSQVHTPLMIGAWEKELASHPDQERVSYLLNGLRNGFRIGYNYKDNTCQPRRKTCLQQTYTHR